MHFKNIAVFAVVAMCVVVLINKKGGNVRGHIFIYLMNEYSYIDKITINT